MTKAWSITGGFEHFWNAQWKTSLYGAYGELRYSDAAAAVIRPAGAAVGSLGELELLRQIGSRTVWTPVANLDLSLEVMYNRLNTGLGDRHGTVRGQELVCRASSASSATSIPDLIADQRKDPRRETAGGFSISAAGGFMLVVRLSSTGTRRGLNL